MKKSKSKNGYQQRNYGIQVVGKLYEDETFGDVSIIQGGVASASVIADEDEVTLYSRL